MRPIRPSPFLPASAPRPARSALLRSFAALAPVPLLLAGCVHLDRPIGIELRAETRFASEWTHYVELPAFKALAVAGDVQGIYVSGLAYGQPDAPSAIDAALDDCEARRRDRRIAATCRLHAAGDERAGEAAQP